MADNFDAWFDESVVAALDDTAADPAEDTPVSDTAPRDEEPVEAADAPAEETETLEAEAESQTEIVAEAAGAEDEPTQEQSPPPVNWDADDNPYRTQAQQLQQKAEQFDRMQQVAQALTERRAQELANQRLSELSDDDPQKVTELRQFIEQQQQPIQRQVAALNDEIEVVSKAATVYDAAVRLFVDPQTQAKIDTEVDRLMRLPGGYSVLQNHLETRTQLTNEANSRISELENETARLRKQLLAKTEIAERTASGADLVDGGGNTSGTFGARWDKATGDDALDVIIESLR